MKRWITLGAIAVIAGIGLLGFRLSTQPPSVPGDPVKIRIGAYSGHQALLAWLARDKDFYAAAGVEAEVESYRIGKLAARALVNNLVDVATATDFVLAKQGFAHPDLRVLAAIGQSRTKSLVARKDRNIEGLEDLAGKQIGVTYGSSSEYFLGRLLAFNGYGLADVTVVNLPPSKMASSLVEGTVDAVFTWEPIVHGIQQRMGEAVEVFPGHQGQPTYFFLMARKNWIQDNPSAARRIVDAFVRAGAFVEQNPAEAKKRFADLFDVDPAHVDHAWGMEDFRVEMPQSLLIILEDQARWLIENELVEADKVPDYLDYLVLEPISSVAPELVTVIR